MQGALPQEEFSYMSGLFLFGRSAAHCQAYIAQINTNSQLKSKHNLHNIFGNFCKFLYIK